MYSLHCIRALRHPKAHGVSPLQKGDLDVGKFIRLTLREKASLASAILARAAAGGRWRSSYLAVLCCLLTAICSSEKCGEGVVRGCYLARHGGSGVQAWQCWTSDINVHRLPRIYCTFLQRCRVYSRKGRAPCSCCKTCGATRSDARHALLVSAVGGRTVGCIPPLSLTTRNPVSSENIKTLSGAVPGLSRGVFMRFVCSADRGARAWRGRAWLYMALEKSASVPGASMPAALCARITRGRRCHALLSRVRW